MNIRNCVIVGPSAAVARGVRSGGGTGQLHVGSSSVRSEGVTSVPPIPTCLLSVLGICSVLHLPITDADGLTWEGLACMITPQ
jgi:hypothetical protein